MKRNGKPVIFTANYAKAKLIAKARNIGMMAYYSVVPGTPYYIVAEMEKATVILDTTITLDRYQRRALDILKDKGAEIETYSL